MKKKDFDNFLNWYKENARPLPWRFTKDPYSIWISETMLQQTTATAVIPYYQRFLEEFPKIENLANSPLEKVYELWAGLGYYSRARNLHKAAQAIQVNGGFPHTWKELIHLPGFGPYTSRAVSSFAFDEKVGVLDGNVIRFLSRYYDLHLEWWTTRGRSELQDLSDQLAQKATTGSQVNQALMEMGATICTPSNPSCVICPLLKSCRGRKFHSVDSLPLKKPKKAKEHWVLNVQLYRKDNKWAMIKNVDSPFLKNQWVFPAKSQKVPTPPQKYTLRHAITHHDIYVNVRVNKNNSVAKKWNSHEVLWVSQNKIKQKNPSSLLQKILANYE